MLVKDLNSQGLTADLRSHITEFVEQLLVGKCSADNTFGAWPSAIPICKARPLKCLPPSSESPTDSRRMRLGVLVKRLRRQERRINKSSYTSQFGKQRFVIVGNQAIKFKLRHCDQPCRRAYPGSRISATLSITSPTEFHKRTPEVHNAENRQPAAALAFARPRLEVEDPAVAGVAPTFETKSTVEYRRNLETIGVHRRRLVTVRATGVVRKSSRSLRTSTSQYSVRSSKTLARSRPPQVARDHGKDAFQCNRRKLFSDSRRRFCFLERGNNHVQGHTRGRNSKNTIYCLLGNRICIDQNCHVYSFQGED